VRRLLARLVRAERLLAVTPPPDPRRHLPRDEERRIWRALEVLGARNPAPLAPEEAAWFERTAGPLLPAWIAHDARLLEWKRRRNAARRARHQRQHFTRDHLAEISEFSQNAVRALERLGLVPPTAAPI
jgi:hypothetical protein